MLRAAIKARIVAIGNSQGIRIPKPLLEQLNHHLRTAIVAPMTTGRHAYPFRPACRFGDKEGRVALDQIRTVDRDRLRKRLGVMPATTLSAIFAVLDELFEFA